MTPSRSTPAPAEDAPTLLRPINLFCGCLQAPAADMCDTLRLTEECFASPQPLLRTRTFDCPRNQRACRLEDFDFHIAPDTLVPAVVEANKSPPSAIDNDWHRNE